MVNCEPGAFASLLPLNVVHFIFVCVFILLFLLFFYFWFYWPQKCGAIAFKGSIRLIYSSQTMIEMDWNFNLLHRKHKNNPSQYSPNVISIISWLFSSVFFPLQFHSIEFNSHFGLFNFIETLFIMIDFFLLCVAHSTYQFQIGWQHPMQKKKKIL